MVPHILLLDMLQLALLPIGKDLFLVRSHLKWAKATLEGTLIPGLTYENPKDRLTRIHAALTEAGPPLKTLMGHILAFTPFTPLKQALLDLNRDYQALPAIDTELNLMHLGTDPLEDKELVLTLLLFTDHLLPLQQSHLLLKKSLLNELIRSM